MTMDPKGWWDEFKTDVRSSPANAAFMAGFRAYLGAWHTITSRYPLGTNIYSRDWDLLILLDACRVDALREVAPEYDFLGEVGTIWSRGSGSHEWLARTFTDEFREEISETTFTTPNGFAEKAFLRGEPPTRHPTPFEFADDRSLVGQDAFDLLDVTWKFSQDPTFRITLPRFMTDRAIHIGRERSPDRLIVHYYQPHKPHLAAALSGEDLEDHCKEPWEAVKNGRVTTSRVWKNYLDNLRLVLDEVGLMLDNYDADDVVITADHGEAFGEFGAYGHPEGFPHPATRRVPWVSTRPATDSGAREPISEHCQRVGRNPPTWDEDRIREKLGELGYA
jgi:hypothetical protein